MEIKKQLKSVIGAERLSNIKGVIYHYGCLMHLRINHRTKLCFDENKLMLIGELSEKGYHVFRGYYDLEYVSQNGKNFLCHRIPLKAQTNRDVKCEVGYYELEKGNFVKISETAAWCWQQGSRLRWLPHSTNLVSFNDATEQGYCTRVYDVEECKCVDTIDWPLYDITPDFKWGLSLNYSRLQRLRPGYGYNYIGDETENQKAPDYDGIVLVDLEQRAAKVIYTLKQLAQRVDPELKYVHYLNHISVSPSGTRFMFIHIYTNLGEKGWNTVLYISDIKGTVLKELERKDRVSHYFWIDNDHLMATCQKDNGIEYYCIYCVNTGRKEIMSIQNLDSDGHPGKIENGYLTDTYPLKNSLQKLKTYNFDSSEATTIASIYHDYRLRGEKRCDLHPSISKRKNLISVDTTYAYKKRSILMFELVGGKNICLK